jgi:hypothetical protein
MIANVGAPSYESVTDSPGLNVKYALLWASPLHDLFVDRFLRRSLIALIAKILSHLERAAQEQHQSELPLRKRGPPLQSSLVIKSSNRILTAFRCLVRPYCDSISSRNGFQ